MKKLFTFALALLMLAAPLAAQTAASFTGKWEGTYVRTLDNGTESTSNIVFNLTQKGAVLTGTAGPAGKELAISNAAVKAGKATFEVQQPDGGILFKFSLSVVKDRLQGDMTGERGGALVGKAKVDAGKAKAK